MSANQWINTTPASGDQVSSGDDKMREDRVNTSERTKQGGHYMANADPVSNAQENDDGKHVAGYGPNGGPHIYRSDRSTKLVDFSSDTVIDMTNATTLTAPGVTTGTDPGHKHSGSIVFRIGSTLASGRQKVLFDTPRNMEIYSVQLVVGTRPGSGTLDVDLLDLGGPADAVDRFAVAGQSIFEPGHRPTLAAAGNYSVTKAGATDFYNGAGGTTFYTLAAGRELGLDIISTGTSTADLIVYIYARRL